jgi:hypothetical protein
LDIEALLLRIRDKIVTEAAQLTTFRGRSPGVVVLHNFVLNQGPDAITIVTMGLDEQGIVGALCGFLTTDMYTAISAVAVLKTAQPHEHL